MFINPDCKQGFEPSAKRQTATKHVLNDAFF